MKVLFIIIFILLIVSCHSKLGEIVFNKNVFEFGEIYHGQSISDSLVVKNIGESKIDFSIFADCGCTILEEGIIELDPYDSQIVKFNFKPNNFGFVQQKILFESQDNEILEIVLLRANVKPY
ncbi:MAG: DUF1573 domain-containing protein [Bacteroidota bacterium]